MPSAVLATLRRLRLLAAALVVVMTAGPAGAVCTHALAGGTDGAAETHGATGHVPEHEAPPCHGGPEGPADEAPAHEAPASHGDSHHCASACCAGPAPTPNETALAPAVAGDVVPPPAVAIADAPAGAPVPVPVATPPPPTLRVHLALQRFLI